MRQALAEFGHDALFEEDETEAKDRKFWIMRRQSFNLLRKKVKDKHTAPFIDDLVVPPNICQNFCPNCAKLSTSTSCWPLLPATWATAISMSSRS